MEFPGCRRTWDLLEDHQDYRIISPARHSCPSYHPAAAENSNEPGRLSFSRLSSSPAGSPWKKLYPIPRSPSPSILYICLASLESQAGNVFSIAISRGTVYTGSESERLRVWKQPDCVDRGYIQTGHGDIRAILACGSTVFTTHKDHRVRVWSVTVSDRLRAKKLATLPQRNSFLSFHRKRDNQHKDCISCIACNYVDGLLYTGSWDGTVKAWRLARRECVDSFAAHEEHINAIVVNQEDGCLFTGSSDGSVKLWRRVFGDSSHALVATLRFQASGVNTLVLSQGINGTSTWFLYSGSSDGYVSVWEKEELSGRFNHGGFLRGHRYAVLCLAAVERLVFSGSEDTTIRVWRREGSGHECLAVMEGHRGPVRSLAARVEVGEEMMGVLVYSASLDRMVKVWRVKVMVGEGRKGGGEDQGDKDDDDDDGEYVASPVLSPLWVKKKLQRGDQFY